eukprot:TRINITY_DN798_c0_g1_i6.p1 TRINITY_DN798_c0_g1~~TRINITY_DN798_c0_g1_i6.p1  ORF type:complete len:729 (-),score=218.13 TRINITY_DN798_c0_g1_i6:1726-3912(-)
MLGLVTHEKQVNQLILKLTRDHCQELANELDSLQLEATLLVPQSVSLEGVTLSPSFVRAHIVICNPNNASQFVSLSGVMGILDMQKDNLFVVSPPPPSFDPLTGKPEQLFTTEKQLFDEYDQKQHEEDPQTVVILRQDRLAVQGTATLPFILIAGPLVYDGCDWAADPCTPTKCLQPQSTPIAIPVIPYPAISEEAVTTVDELFSKSQPGTATFSPATSPNSAAPDPLPCSSAPVVSSPIVSKQHSPPRATQHEPLFPESPPRTGAVSALQSVQQLQRAMERQSEAQVMRLLQVPQRAVSAPVLSPPMLPSQSSVFSPQSDPFFAKLERAPDVINMMRQFLQQFPTTLATHSITAKGHELHSFIDSLAQRLCASHPLWRETDDTERAALPDALEKYLTFRLYNTIFPASAGETAEDEKLRLLFTSLQWITLKHFDVQLTGRELDAGLQLAQHELRRINDYRTPKDKVQAIYMACKVIFQVMKLVQNKSQGADEFLPVLIYVVLHANPANFNSNIEYIGNFRNHSFMNSESGYYYVNVVSAVTFLQNLTPGQLNLTVDEFNSFSNAKTPRGRSSSSSTPVPTKRASAPLISRSPPAVPDEKQVALAAKHRRAVSEIGAPSQRATWFSFMSSSKNKEKEQAVAAAPATQPPTPPPSQLSPRPSPPSPATEGTPVAAVPADANGAAITYAFADVDAKELRVCDVERLLAEYKLLVTENRRLAAALQQQGAK